MGADRGSSGRSALVSFEPCQVLPVPSRQAAGVGWRGAVAVASVLLIAPAAGAQVRGVVVEAVTGEPVPAALVSVQASDVETRADEDGSFVLAEAAGADLVVTGAAVGFFTGSVRADAGATDVRIELERVPPGDDPTYLFVSPLSCAHCHWTQYEQWASGAMAHAGRNAWVADLYAGNGTDGGAGGFVYMRDSVHAEESPASECASCHQPVVWAKDPFVALAPPDSDDYDVDEGVSCDVCHKIASVDESRMSFPGLHPETVRLTRPGPGWTVLYGVLGDVDFYQEAEMRASYQPQLRAVVCGTCHQDRNDPDHDGDFEDEDGVLSEATYQEWLESPYADPESERHATCVDCHMPPTTEPDACSALFPGLSRPEGEIRAHRFEGTTPAMLENAVTLALDARLDGDRIAVDVTVTNDQTGHHVPTGVTIRNVVLVVDAWRVEDGERLEHIGGDVVHALGGEGDPEAGYFAGLPGKLYAKINHGPDGTGPVFYTEATGILSDTRLAPLASDTTSHAFRVPADGGELHVEARLIYRRAWRALVDAKGWTTDGHGNPLADVAPPHYGHLMQSAEEVFSLPYTGPRDAGVDAAMDAGGQDAGAADAGDTATDVGAGCGCGTAGVDRGRMRPWVVTLLTAGLLGARRRRRATPRR